MADQTILYPAEVEKVVLRITSVIPEQLPSLIWYKQQNYIDLLFAQASIGDSDTFDETVKQCLIEYSKMDTLVEHLICVELWIENVLPVILQQNLTENQSFIIYMILYNEKTLVDLLESVLFYTDAMGSLNRGYIDIFEYVYRRLVDLNGMSFPNDERIRIYATSLGQLSTSSTNAHSEGHMLRLNCYRKQLRYDISVKCISIMNYFANNIENLPDAIITKLYGNYDVLGLFINLNLNMPWCVKLDDGSIHKYNDDKWHAQGNVTEVRLQLLKVDVHVWNAIYQMTSSNCWHQKYALTSSKKGVLLGLHVYLTEALLEQLPMLENLKVFLKSISHEFLAAPDATSQPDQDGEIRLNFSSSYATQWPSVQQTVLQYLMSVQYSQELRTMADEWWTSLNGSQTETATSIETSSLAECYACRTVAVVQCSRCRPE